MELLATSAILGALGTLVQSASLALILPNSFGLHWYSLMVLLGTTVSLESLEVALESLVVACGSIRSAMATGLWYLFGLQLVCKWLV